MIRILPLILILYGCGSISLPVVVVKGSAEGFTYAETGKTLTSHLLSFIIEKDCSIFNFFYDKKICEEYLIDKMMAIDCHTYGFDEDDQPFCRVRRNIVRELREGITNDNINR